MEEKKLTDEEIVKALECCNREEVDCENCPYHKKNITCYVAWCEDTLDLIHRLQAENEELKSPKFASWKLKFFRLKEERENIQAVIFGLEEDKRLLQNQVDELKAENTELYKEHTTLIAGSILERKNIAKDTAKEILNDLRNIFIEQSSYGSDVNQHIGYYDYVVKIGLVIEQVEEYAKLKYGIEYGVEVE